ncbi:DUF3231 family protein [Cytobacillus oceanisediminis]|uniref:DUF3231 family protein n=1 Tax=Cytobacillus oceanisediminis TaxID=665099 RepID=UPI0023D9A162|nr:DUF3231 family protein [Cytobacillus oceanisediminis]MDF2035707.1 DUF3231 family protein [Cytobacillus oceanisediminis]
MNGSSIPKLISSEMALLWNTYVADTAAVCCIKHYIQTNEDPDVLPVLKYALSIAQDHINDIASLFKKEEFPIPDGFNEKDLNNDTPKLFSDITYLRFMHHLGRTGLNAYSLAKSVSARKDVRSMFKKYYEQTEKLFDMAAETMQAKGIFIRSPYIEYPKKVKYVSDHRFLGGIVGKRRQLLAIEIAHLGTNIELSNIAKTMLLAFSQVAKQKKISDYFKKGYEMSLEHVEYFLNVLKNDDVAYPSTWDGSITDSTTSPFSDRLMMFLIASITAVGVMDFGIAIGASIRKDLAIQYAKMMIKVGDFADDGAKIMIDNGWLEKPPQSLDREELRNK